MSVRWTPREDAVLMAEVATKDRWPEIAERVSKRIGRVVSGNVVSNRAYKLRIAGALRTPSPATIPRRVEDSSPRVVEVTRGKVMSLEDICDALKAYPSQVRAEIDEALAAGYSVDIDGAFVGKRPAEESTSSVELHVDSPGDRRIIAGVGDIHFGSKHHLRPQFEDFCKYAYERGVRLFLHAGDMLDGVYKHSVWEQDRRGYEEQVGYAVENLPRFPGATWYFIEGNHDETLGEASGINVGKAMEQSFIAAGRSDVKYLGPRRAYVRVVGPGEKRGVFVELWHPRDKSAAYAKSYRLQKHVEAYAPGQKPDILLTGHWHQQMYFTTRGVHCMSLGCWQGSQSSFGKSLSGAPDIGSWIVEYSLTENGTIRHFKPEWCGYYEQETVRDVSLG